MKTGILGGTFDPIHYAHMMLAEYAYEVLSLNRVLVMPAGDPYLKLERGISSDEDRAEMTRLAISSNPHFVFSDLELKREGNTYTVDTLNILKEEDPDDELFFITGSDTLFQMESWKDPGRIFEIVAIVTSSRGIDDANLNAQAEHLRKHFGAVIHILDMPQIDISSTAIRSMISEGRSARYMTEDAVLEYIRKKGLYK